MILTEYVEVKIANRNVKYYKEVFGNWVRIGQVLEVPVEKLLPTNLVMVEVQCDYCGEKFARQYRLVLEGRKHIDKDTCRKCSHIKVKQTNLLRYGVESATQLPEVKERVKETMLKRYGVTNSSYCKESLEKRKRTNLQKYGVDNPMKNKEIQKKAERTSMERYGAPTFASSEQGRKKIIQISLERYGTEWPFQSKGIQEKAKESLVKKYGRPTCLLDPEVKKKIDKTVKERYGSWENLKGNMFGEDGIPSSKQQRELQKYYNCELNTQIGCYYADLYFPESKTIIEYDGSGHNIDVKYHRLTQEEFEIKEDNRENYLLELGYKLGRISNPNDIKIGEDFALQIKQIIFDNLKDKNYFVYKVEKQERDNIQL